MLCCGSGQKKMVPVYGHNSVSHNVEAVRLAKAGAKSIVHKIKRRGRSHELQSEWRKQKSNRAG